MKIITKFYKHITQDSLYRNSIYLMLSTGVMAVLGFFFWIINARFFTTEQVGIATTLLSIASLISSFSLLGLNNGIIRYLPTSERKNEKINTAFTLVALTSIFLALIYLISINIFSPKLLFVRENIFFALLFIIFVVFISLNLISENVFIAYRQSKYVLFKNTAWSVIKLSLPFIFIIFGAYGIFMSVGIATVISFLLCLLFLLWKFNYLIKPIIHMDIVRRMVKFSLGNYLAGFIGGLPTMILPLLILNHLGAKFSAFYYMDMMIANLLYIIPMATSQSLFAEGSQSEKSMGKFLNKSLMLNAFLLLPAMMLVYFFGKYLLLVFGFEYAREGTKFLQLLAVSAPFVYINAVGSVLLNIRHQIKKMVMIIMLGALLIVGLSYFLVSKELLGIGAAWIIGQGAISIIYLFTFKKLL